MAFDPLKISNFRCFKPEEFNRQDLIADFDDPIEQVLVGDALSTGTTWRYGQVTVVVFIRQDGSSGPFRKACVVAGDDVRLSQLVTLTGNVAADSTLLVQ